MSLSATDFTNAADPAFRRWDIPVKAGILIGLASVLLTTVNNMFVLPGNYLAYLGMMLLIFAGTVAGYGITGARQRTAMGGYISIKDAFAAIFVAILISSAITTLWSIFYVKVIDPHVVDKVKEGTLAFMERMKVPQEKIDEQAEMLDKQIAKSQGPAQLALSYAKGLIVQAIFGFICAAIVKREPKAAL